MASLRKSVLITGCSEGGMGAALAHAFHDAGLRVYATSRDASKMQSLARAGIETLALDVLSSPSIASCVAKLHHLDILVNNAGTSYSMPIADLALDDARELFDVNLWAQLAVTQAFLPLLRASKGTIINQTSVVAATAVPFQSAYNASKAAFAMFSDCLRLELEPFDVRVIDLKTGGVASNMIKNQKARTPTSIPHDSIYAPAREAVEAAMRNDKMADVGTPTDQWAKEVVGDVLRKNPPLVIWRGANARLGRIGTIMPYGMMDSTIKKMTGLDIVALKVREL